MENQPFLSEDERMMIRKDPPLDQTGGLKDKKKEGSMHQLALHLKQLQGVQADLLHGLNLDNCLPALVEAYDADKAILDTYEESTILKWRREDDDQEGPSAGSDQGSKRLREGGEHASASTPSETTTGSAGRSTTGSQSRQLFASEFAFAEEPVQTTYQMEEPSHPVFETGVDD
nr:hypothetical protein [Tanacetum cinerariifolium]